jgi:5-methyltetrahydropteroyltriglutamate--homocysteine methyltransferase
LAAVDRDEDAGEETFVTAASPGIVTTTMTLDEQSEFDATDEEYVLAVAEQLKQSTTTSSRAGTFFRSMRRTWRWSVR